MKLSQVLASSRIVVCVGSGGVGKTTVAAAIGVCAALRGRRTMVLTIDPARRLAEALGVETLRAGGEEISAERLRSAGLSPTATLSAGMLDQVSAWDEFIARHSPNDEVRETILANSFYQNLSRSFAGSTEYMAIEELARIEESNRYDLIVLDTPPSRHALDFLEAPRRMEDLFDRSVLSWLAGPASAGWSVWKTASRGARFVFERIEEATGLQTLTEIASFFAAIESLVDGVSARSKKVRSLLQAADTSFVLVTGPDEQVLEDAEGLASSMGELGVTLGAVVMNRMQDAGEMADATSAATALDQLLERLRNAGARQDVLDWVAETVRERLVQASSQSLRREAFEAGLPEGISVTAVAEQPRDVHDLHGLASIARQLDN